MKRGLKIGDRRYPTRPAWISSYPVASEEAGPAMILRATAYGDTVDMVLSLDDLRRLIVDLDGMADVLGAEQALIDARSLGLSA